MNDYRFLRFFKVIIFGAGAVLLITYATMLLWNWLVPQLFSGPYISFLQALGIIALSKILLSGFKGRCSCQTTHKGHFWKTKLQEKFEKMTPEEKERFKAKFKGCWIDKEENDISYQGDSLKN